jgi:hypothetical protein
MTDIREVTTLGAPGPATGVGALDDVVQLAPSLDERLDPTLDLGRVRKL